MKTSLKLILALILLLSIFSAPQLASAATVAAGSPCSCLIYFEKATGLPATGASPGPNSQAQNYATWLRNKKL